MITIQKRWIVQWTAELMMWESEFYSHQSVPLRFYRLVMHAEHGSFQGVGPRTISVPRIRNADDVDASSFLMLLMMKPLQKLLPSLNCRSLYQHDNLHPGV